MAMNAGSAGVGGLADEIYQGLNAEFGADPAVDADRQAYCNVIAAAIITHIQTNATISTTVAVTNVSGVTSGAGTSGPGAGTGTGTIA